MYTVTQIEDAVLATLESDNTLVGYVRLFTPIPSLDEDRLKQLINVYPAVGVMAGKGDYSYAMSGIQEDDGIFSILCFNENLRSLIASVRGAAGDKGVWDMVDDARRILLPGPSALIGVSVLECIPTRRLLLRATKPFAIAALEVRIRWRNS